METLNTANNYEDIDYDRVDVIASTVSNDIVLRLTCNNGEVKDICLEKDLAEYVANCIHNGLNMLSNNDVAYNYNRRRAVF